MTIKEMQQRKRELGYSNEVISQKSGVPLSTVQKVLGGRTKAPRSSTLRALESALAKKAEYTCAPIHSQSRVAEPAASYGTAAAKKNYTIQDMEALPEDVHAELIDGQIYYMAPPTSTHQRIIVEMLFAIKSYIKEHNGPCEIFPAPFAVYLNGETGRDYLEPDLVVICNPDRIQQKGCMGAPDWVMEVISPSTKSRDYAVKLLKYRTAGVREYWIVNPDKRIVNVYRFDQEPEAVDIYTFEEEITFSIYPDLSVKLSELL